MSSSKEDGTAAAAAQQLGSLSLGEKTVGKKDNDTEPTTKNGTTPAKLCSACETKSDALMKCRACKCVYYCDKKCQNKHWKEHKKECKHITNILDERGGKLDVGTEMDIGPLAKMPPREECQICMRVLPIDEGHHAYASCCGKTLCCGCNFQHQMKSRELSLPLTCAFCREPIPRSDEEILAQLHKRIKRKDANALRNVALHYGNGGLGLPVNETKCVELLRESAFLRNPSAAYNLGNFYNDGEMGLEKNEEETLKYWKKAAEGGNIRARNNLACTEAASGDLAAAMRHWRLAASGGYRKSMNALIILCFEDGMLHQRDLAECLQTFYRARAEMKSEDRDQYIKHLKTIGEYEAEYDC